MHTMYIITLRKKRFTTTFTIRSNTRSNISIGNKVISYLMNSWRNNNDIYYKWSVTFRKNYRSQNVV